MDKFDLIVIGAGAGLHVVSVAATKGWEVALVDQGPLGGVCLNTGCTPSKILIYPADVVRNLEDAAAVGIEGEISKKDFQKIMSRMHSFVNGRRIRLEETIRARKKVTLYKETAEFVSDRVLKVGDKMLTAPKIVIASGARAMIPSLPGLKEVGYLDHASLLKLDEPPRSMIIIGAGFIGCEYGHFFSAMGTEITILGRGTEVLSKEDPEVCRIIKMALSRYMNVLTRHEVIEVKKEGDRKVVLARNHNDGMVYRFDADEILVATGRRSNADILNPNKTGVEMDEHGWIKTNDYLETTRSGIWAIGDALGRNMFRHAAKYEAEVVSHNMLYARKREEMVKVDFHAVPHAVATYPAVAGVGLKEAEALAAGYKVLVGRVRYTDMVMGFAMDEENGFIKAVVEEETGRILGCSIVGSEASSLIQQVVYLMNKENQDLLPMMRSEVIHPTLSELLVRAFSNLEHPRNFHAA
ncbi:MAG TPA: dihydrolipoyl dehydrogenase [Methanotrichaceae archaeon]|nr:dihydrolipoyl dehydrogenase [Methanotrichaceae archaeon]